jgi:hypothetical protein
MADESTVTWDPTNTTGHPYPAQVPLASLNLQSNKKTVAMRHPSRYLNPRGTYYIADDQARVNLPGSIGLKAVAPDAGRASASTKSTVPRSTTSSWQRSMAATSVRSHSWLHMLHTQER